MRKLLPFLVLIALSISTFAQCDPAIIKDMPSVYTKFNGARLTPEQQKWTTTIFTSALELAFQSTKGLKGTWDPMGDFPVTPEGLTKTNVNSYLFTLGCKDNKLYKKDEQGLVLNFTLNSFKSIYKSDIMQECSHEETRWEKFDASRKVYVDDLFEGRQIYYLQPATETKDYPNVAFYRKTGDAEYFVLTKPGVPFFIPLTKREALEINKKNTASILEELKKAFAMPGLQPETKADYEKKMAKDFAEYRRSFPNPEKFITDLIEQLEDLKPAMIMQQQHFIDWYTKSIKLVSDYLKNTPAKELDKPCITSNSLLSFPFDETKMAGIESNFKDVESRKFGSFVTFNPAYFNKTISKTAPQFISVELRIQGNSAVALKAYNDFKANLNLAKLQSLLVK